MKKTLSRKLASGVVLGCLVLSLGSVAFASPNGQECPPPAMGCHEGRPGGDQGDFVKKAEVSFDKLVKQGTITAKQKKDLVKFIKNQDKERKAEMDATKNMNHEERHAYLEKKHGDPVDMVQKMMDVAHLTKEQAQAVDDELRPPAPPHDEHHGMFSPR